MSRTNITAILTLPKTQDALRIPLEWNAQWEELCTRNAFPPEVCLANAMSTSNMTSKYIFDQYSTLLQSTCELQYHTGIQVIQALEKLNFEQQWNTASVADRRKHVLIGMSKSCAIAQDLNEARMYCGDVLKLDYLSQDPQVLLHLLTDILPNDLSVIPTTPYFIPNVAWDTFKAKKERNGMTELEKVYIAQAMIIRTKLIYYVLQLTLLSFVGIEPPKATVSKAKTPSAYVPDPNQRLAKKALEQAYGKQQLKVQIKNDKAAAKERASQLSTICAQLDCRRVEKSDDEKFMRCSRCNESGLRTTKYCSKECQKKDWKGRHKAICGKALSDIEAAVKAAVPPTVDAPAIGPSIPPFKRSPALTLHVCQLNSAPEVDLFLRIGSRPDREQFTNMRIPFKPVQTILRNHRDIAMTTGDKTAVAKLCQFVVWFFMAKNFDQSSGWDFEAMTQQMAKEFAIPELKAAMIELQTLQFQDQLSTPPLLAALDPPIWEAFLRVSNVDLTRRIT